MSKAFISASSLAKRRKPKKNPWYTNYHRDLRCQTVRAFKTSKANGHDPASAREYTISRNAYHKSIRFAKRQHQFEEVQNLIGKAHVEGISCIYKHKKKANKPPAVTSGIQTFLDYARRLFISETEDTEFLRQGNDLDHEESHPLMKTISQEEVKSALSKQKSRAPGVSGF